MDAATTADSMAKAAASVGLTALARLPSRAGGGGAGPSMAVLASKVAMLAVGVLEWLLGFDSPNSYP